MVDVGIGQAATLTGRLRSKKLKDAVSDAHPLYEAMQKEGGIVRAAGGRTILDEALSGQNTTVGWVGESGAVPINDVQVADSPEYDWKYQLGAVNWTLAEQYKNSGPEKYIDLITAKYEALEASMMNEFHEGMLSTGTGDGGLQLGGVGLLVSTTPTTGTVGGINRANANAAWFRNQAFNTATDWALGSVDETNVKKFLDRGINSTMRNSKSQIQLGFMGDTHWPAYTAVSQTTQIIMNEQEPAKPASSTSFTAESRSTTAEVSTTRALRR
jgi:hypothetical protein